MKLRDYFFNHKFAEMMNHIGLLTMKYPIEIKAWNSENTVRIPDFDYEQHFRTADKFLETVAKERFALYMLQAGVGGNQNIVW